MLNLASATAAAIELSELNSFAVILEERADGTGRRIEIQKALSFDDQDRRLNQDTYCVSTETGASFYGGVASWNLEDRVLRIELSEMASKTLGIATQVTITLDEPHELSSIAQALEAVLAER